VKNYSLLAEYEIGSQIKLQATIAEQLFYNEESTYGVYRVISTENKKMTCLISGYFPYELLPKTVYDIKGTITQYKEEKQIKLEAIYMQPPAKEQELIASLKHIKGLKKTAEQLVQRYGLNTISLLINHPEQVAEEFNSITKEQAYKLSLELQIRYAQIDIREQLKLWGFTQKQAEAIVQQFGQTALLIVRKNPYELIHHIHGIGFKTIDKLAGQFGISRLSEQRVIAAIHYCLSEASSRGHCYLLRSMLIEQLSSLISLKLTAYESAALLSFSNNKKLISYEYEGVNYKINSKQLMSFMEQFDREANEQAREKLFFVVEGYSEKQLIGYIEQLAEAEQIILQDDRVYLRDYYVAELKLAYKVIQLLLYEGQVFNNQAAIKQVLQHGGYKLEKKQLEAVTAFTSSEGGFMILNGSAGCGKTFTLNIILEVLEAIYTAQGQDFRVKIMAPTGKAAQVASIATKRNATTIHRGLQWKPDGGFQFNEQDQLQCDCLVIDESSMLDIRLAYMLSKAIKQNCKVIFMGDTKQLQSVGAGNVLHDLIATGLVPIVTLDVIKRQGKDSGIVTNARRIINHDMIVSETKKGDSFFVEAASPAQTLQLLLKGANKLIKTRGYSINDIQVLSPMRKGLLGVDYLNFEMQRAFNRNIGADQLFYFNKSVMLEKNENDQPQKIELNFYVGDKVIHLVNDYKMQWYSYTNGSYTEIEKQGITNGECGIISEIKKFPSENAHEQIRITVKYDEGYVHYINPGGELDHCYAMTIHKSQGSQWPAVFMPITFEHRHMLNNSIVYTGFTRAKQFQCVVGDSAVLRHAIKHDTMESRLTSLRERFLATP